MKQEFKQLMHQQGIDLNDKQVELIACYFDFLYTSNQKTNLTGYKTANEYVQFHLLDTIEICRLFDFNKVNSLLDVGTGCGVPGIIIKILYPHLHLALLESTKKKTDFLLKSITKLDLSEIQVIQNRAEFLAHDQTYRENYHVVIARALAPFTVSLELTSGFVEQNGFVLLPRGASEEQKNIEMVCNELSLAFISSSSYTLIGREESFTLHQFKKIAKLNEKYPRKPGIIKKRPL